MVGFTGYTENFVYFCVFRALTGVGFAMMFPNTLVLALCFYPPTNKKRLLMLTVFSALTGLGFFSGLMMPSVIADFWWWPWTFWLGSITALILAVLNYLILPSGIDTFLSSNTTEKRKLDYFGAFLYSSSIILAIAMIIEGAAVGWKENPWTYILFLFSWVLYGIFMFYDRRISKDPLIPIDVFIAESWFVISCLICGWAGYGIWLFNSARFSMLVDGNSNIITALHFLPTVVVGVISTVSSSYLTQKLPLSVVILLGLLAFLAANVLTGTKSQGQVYWGEMFCSCLVLPWALDLSIPASTIVIQKEIPLSLQGSGAAVVSTSLFFSVSVGIAIGGNAEIYTLKNRGIAGDAETYKHAIRNLFHVAMAINGLGVLIAIMFVVYQLKIKKERQTCIEKDCEKEKDLDSRSLSV